MAARPPRSQSGAGLRRSLRQADFRRVTSEGRRSETAYFLVFCLERGDGGAARLGITVTRRVGGAVRRNRIKRLVREWFRHRRRGLRGRDLVVIAKRELPERLTQREVDPVLDSALRLEERSPGC